MLQAPVRNLPLCCVDVRIGFIKSKNIQASNIKLQQGPRSLFELLNRDLSGSSRAMRWTCVDPALTTAVI